MRKLSSKFAYIFNNYLLFDVNIVVVVVDEQTPDRFDLVIHFYLKKNQNNKISNKIIKKINK